MANNFTEQDIRAIIRDEFRQMAGANLTHIEWLNTSEASKRLNYSSPDALRKAITDGTLRIGKKVQDRRKRGNVNSRYFFNISACIKRLNTPPEKRAN